MTWRHVLAERAIPSTAPPEMVAEDVVPTAALREPFAARVRYGSRDAGYDWSVIRTGPESGRKERGLRSVRTTFAILEAVAVNQPIGLSELARRLQLPKSTVQRSLATLADLGWIRTDGRDGTRWTLGDRVRTLAESVDDLGRLREAALPVLGSLNEETSETVHLAVPEGAFVRLVERQDSKHALRLVKAIGTRTPLHAGSTGKSVLAYIPQREVDAYIQAGLTPLTSHTITDPDELLAELERIREQGYAVGDQELDLGATSVAAAIRLEGGRPVASISISGPSSRIEPELFDQYGKLVSAAAKEVAANLRL